MDTRTTNTHLLIVGSTGAGWTSVEALRAVDGVVLWAYEPRGELAGIARADGTVFASTWPNHPNTDRPARIAALDAATGLLASAHRAGEYPTV